MPGNQVVLLDFGTISGRLRCRAVGRHGLVCGGNSQFLPRCPAGGTYGKKFLVLQDGTPVCPALTPQPGHTMTSYGSMPSVLTVCMSATIKGW